MKRFLLASIRLYQLILSPWLGHHCRFYPSCSNYAAQAIEAHGSLRGGSMAVRRLLRCHPWHAGGFDPIPGAPRPDTSSRDSREASADSPLSVH